MTKTQKKRALLGSLFFIGGTLAVGLIIFALKQNINLFYTPKDIEAGRAPIEKRIRVGGMVRVGSLERGENLNVTFLVTDYAQDVRIHYTGILPDLFREKQGVVATGMIKADGQFYAEEILAKHDENYMPPEVAKALKIAGSGP